jgi:hypothetical protein
MMESLAVEGVILVGIVFDIRGQEVNDTIRQLMKAVKGSIMQVNAAKQLEEREAIIGRVRRHAETWAMERDLLRAVSGLSYESGKKLLLIREILTRLHGAIRAAAHKAPWPDTAKFLEA